MSAAPGPPSADGGAPIEVAVPDYVYPLIPRFLDNRRQDIATIRGALGRHDYESIRLLGHRMKGDGGSYGLPQVSELGQRLEQAAAQGAAAEIDRIVAELAAFVDRLRVSKAPSTDPAG